MDVAQSNDIVIVHYTIAYKSGKILESTLSKDPLKFKLGQHIFLPGIEEMIIGMFIGQRKKITLPPEKAFGPKSKHLIQTLPIEKVPSHINKKVGQRVQIDTKPPIKATIIEISNSTITLDGNPEQAGQCFDIDLELIDIIREI